jgi:plastocyanin
MAILGFASIVSGATQPAEQAAVLVQGFAFQPPGVTIAAGGSVTWTIGSDPEQHTVTPREAGAFEGSDQLFTGDTFTVTFDQPGAIEYFCTIHPTMVGTVEVVAASTPSPVETPGAATPTSVLATHPLPSPGPVVTPPDGETASGLPVLLVAAAVGLAAIVLLAWSVRRRA